MRAHPRCAHTHAGTHRHTRAHAHTACTLTHGHAQTCTLIHTYAHLPPQVSVHRWLSGNTSFPRGTRPVLSCPVLTGGLSRWGNGPGLPFAGSGAPPHSTLGTHGSPGTLSLGLCPHPNTGGQRLNSLARLPGPRWGLTPRLYRGPRPSHPGPPPPWPLLHRTLAQGLCSSVGRRAIPSCLFLIRPETCLGAPVPA